MIFSPFRTIIDSFSDIGHAVRGCRTDELFVHTLIRAYQVLTEMKTGIWNFGGNGLSRGRVLGAKADFLMKEASVRHPVSIGRFIPCRRYTPVHGKVSAARFPDGFRRRRTYSIEVTSVARAISDFIA